MSNPPSSSRTVFPLQAITNRVKQLLRDAESKRFWVRANFICESANRSPGGHLYGALVEHDPQGNAVAKMRANIWRSNRERIEAKLLAANCEDMLSSHGEICAECSLQFHPVHGLSLQITDVDPHFSESQLDRNRRVILEQLSKEELLGVNGSLAFPAAPLQIGLITATGSAAFADFVKTLQSSGFSFSIRVVAAKMQGVALQESVLRGFDHLESLDLDVICLVRGGGSPVDLAHFDDELVGRRIAACRRPVWVGIGHEIDLTVPDFVAHTTFKTPTAVAAELVKQVQGQWDKLELAARRIGETCEGRMKLAMRQLETQDNGLRQGLRKHLELQQERYAGRERRVRESVLRRVSGETSRLRNYMIQFRERAARHLARREERLLAFPGTLRTRAKAAIQAAMRGLESQSVQLRKAPRQVESRERLLADREKLLNALRPERLLQRGFSITSDSAGKVVRDASKVQPGEKLRTQLAAGILHSQVLEIEEANNDG